MSVVKNFGTWLEEELKASERLDCRRLSVADYESIELATLSDSLMTNFLRNLGWTQIQEDPIEQVLPGAPQYNFMMKTKDLGEVQFVLDTKPISPQQKNFVRFPVYSFKLTIPKTKEEVVWRITEAKTGKKEDRAKADFNLYHQFDIKNSNLVAVLVGATVARHRLKSGRREFQFDSHYYDELLRETEKTLLKLFEVQCKDRAQDLTEMDNGYEWADEPNTQLFCYDRDCNEAPMIFGEHDKDGMLFEQVVTDAI
ncbi:hypothetical protein L596_010048 [Steinernema carpocapsae]|uniref:Uncharacterized protein n=1 Tax=Steinernema carpocapsae TaxID=34508 RepID=A0A4U5PHG4_STECR|nr:hypothetical protein L596_010048 [Steinernema carpocapsae]